MVRAAPAFRVAVLSPALRALLALSPALRALCCPLSPASPAQGRRANTCEVALLASTIDPRRRRARTLKIDLDLYLSNDQLAWNRPCAAIRFCYDGRASWIHAQLQLLASTFACTHGNQLLGTARALQSERCGEYLTGSCVNKLPRGYNCS